MAGPLAFRCAGAILAALAAWPATAQSISGEAGVVSDYRFRGVSLSDGHPAAQASLTLEHDSGFYGNLWGSTLGHGSQTEIDLTAGYEAEISKIVSVDLFATYDAYPSDGSANYAEATAVMKVARGPASASLGVSFAPPQRGTRDESGRGHANAYVFGAVEYEVPKSPVTLKAGLGYERGWFDEVEHGGKRDWSIGAEVAFAPAKAGLAYVGSNADGGDRHALVASLFLAW
jgi:uncharacterized protein (TIGR02001 family)